MSGKKKLTTFLSLVLAITLLLTGCRGRCGAARETMKKRKEAIPSGWRCTASPTPR